MKKYHNLSLKPVSRGETAESPSPSRFHTHHRSRSPAYYSPSHHQPRSHAHQSPSRYKSRSSSRCQSSHRSPSRYQPRSHTHRRSRSPSHYESRSPSRQSSHRSPSHQSLPHSSFLTCALSTYTPSTRASTRAPSLQGSGKDQYHYSQALSPILFTSSSHYLQ
ncbi:unnamed protein product [Rhizophagus irregularis]|nr:unnamed protein product [Rhizophagus irregularis]